MARNNIIFGIVFAALILIFAIIHLGVSISIVVKARHYGNVYRPERGIAIFNIIISILALIVGAFALVALLINRGALGRIVAIASGILAIFVLSSLIASLAINSLAITYSRSRFQDYQLAYANSQEARNVVDRMQTEHQCCGVDTWLDWSRVGLNASTTTTTTTANNTLTTTPSTGVNSTSTVSGSTVGPTSVIVGSTTTTTASPIGVTTTTSSLLQTTTTTTTGTGSTGSQTGGRRKRQASSSYGGIVGLPTSFGVTMPQSCCTNDLASTGLSFCVSNANNGSNNFHFDGCSKKFTKFAVGQTLGLAVINSFLLILLLAIVPLLISNDGQPSQQHYVPTGEQMASYQQPASVPYYPHYDQNQPPMSYSNYPANAYAYS